MRTISGDSGPGSISCKSGIASSVTHASSRAWRTGAVASAVRMVYSERRTSFFGGGIDEYYESFPGQLGFFLRSVRRPSHSIRQDGQAAFGSWIRWHRDLRL